MTKSSIILVALISIFGFTAISGACTGPLPGGNEIGWVQCQGLLPGVGANGTGMTPLVNSILDNFPNTTINQTTGLPNQSYIGYFIILVGIWISEAALIEIGAHIGGAKNELTILNYVTVMMLVTALVFRMYGLVGGNAVDVAISVCGLTILASIFFNRR